MSFIAAAATAVGVIVPFVSPAGAAAGSFTVTPTSLAFKSVDVASSSTLTTTILNTSTGNVQVHGSFAAGTPYGNATDVKVPDCYVGAGFALVLGPNDRCDIRVRFAPTKAGAAAGTLTIGTSPTSDLPGTRHAYASSALLVTKKVGLSGTGVAPTFTFTPTSAAIGNVTRSGLKTVLVSVKNTSPKPLEFRPTVPAQDFNGGPFFLNYDIHACYYEDPLGRHAMVVRPNGICTVPITFAAGELGAASDIVTVDAFNAPAANPGDYVEFDTAAPKLATKTFKATATSIAPTLTFTPSTAAAGNVTVSGHKIVTVVVKNTSTTALEFRPSVPPQSTFGGPFFIGADSNACYVEDPLGRRALVVPANGACTVSVEFVAEQTGAKSATVTVDVLAAGPAVAPYDYDQDVAPGDTVLVSKTFKATGTGVLPTLTFTPTSAALGNVTISGYKSRNIVVKNTSTTNVQYQVTVPEQEFGGGPFYLGGDTNTCYLFDPLGERAMIVAPGQSCVIPIKFGPSSTGSRTDTVTVNVYAASPAGDPGERVPFYNVAAGALTSKTFQATGNGIVPTFTLSPTSASFGNVTQDDSKTTTVTLKNTSTTSLEFSVDVAQLDEFGGPFYLSPGTDTCYYEDPLGRHAIVVAAGGSCTITIDFGPQSPGSRTTTVTVKAFSAWQTADPGFYDDAFDPNRTVLATKTFKATGNGTPPPN